MRSFSGSVLLVIVIIYSLSFTFRNTVMVELAELQFDSAKRMENGRKEARKVKHMSQVFNNGISKALTRIAVS